MNESKNLTSTKVPKSKDLENVITEISKDISRNRSERIKCIETIYKAAIESKESSDSKEEYVEKCTNYLCYGKQQDTEIVKTVCHSTVAIVLILTVGTVIIVRSPNFAKVIKLYRKSKCRTNCIE